MRTWRVSNVMTHDVITVPEHAMYHEIADLMNHRRISAVPVVDAFHRVVGVVSEADLLHKVEYAGEDRIRRFFDSRRGRAGRAKAHGETARELMTSPAVTTMPDTPLAAAVRLMDQEHVKRLPVVNQVGRVVGILSRSDVLRTFQRSDSDIRSDVRNDVLRRWLQADPDRVTLTVERGVVTLTGTMASRSAAATAVRFTEAVAGVVEVVDELSYDVDDTFDGVLADASGPMFVA